jgi:MFS family permease
MVICGLGVSLMILHDGIMWWSLSAFVSGLGMALLYPNLSAAVSDISHPNWRGSAIGIYRFWRDLGYGIGALALGVAAQSSGLLEAPFLLVSVAMVVCAVILHTWGEETHPVFAPK